MKRVFVLIAFLVMSSSFSFAETVDTKSRLMDVVRPLVYGDWDDVKSFEQAYEVEWSSIHIDPRMRITFFIHQMEEEIRTMMRPACGGYEYTSCYPYSKQTRIFAIEENDTRLGYVVIGKIVDLPSFLQKRPQAKYRNIYYNDGTKAQGPAFFDDVE